MANNLKEHYGDIAGRYTAPQRVDWGASEGTYSESLREKIIRRLLELPGEISVKENDVIIAATIVQGAEKELKDAESKLLVTEFERGKLQAAERMLSGHRRQLSESQNEFKAYRTVARLLTKEDD